MESRVSMVKHKKIKNNGIVFDKQTIQMISKESKVNVALKIIQSTLILLVTFGALNSFISGLKLKVIDSLLFGGLVLLVGLFVLLFSLPRYYRASMPCVAVVFLAVGAIFREPLREGGAIVCNEFIRLFNDYVPANVPLFLTKGHTEPFYITVFLLFAFCVVIGATGYVVFQQGSIAIYILVTVPIAFACFIVGRVPEPISYIVYLLGSFGVIGTRMGIYKKRSKRKISDEKELTYRRVEKQVLHVIGVKVGAIVLVMTTTLFLLCWLFFSPQKYEEGVNFTKLKVDMQDTISKIEKGELTKDTIFDKLFPFAHVSAMAGLSGGNLGKNEKVVFRNETALEVTAPSTFEDTYYLRGYTGSQYKNNKWKQLSKEDQKKLAGIEGDLESEGSSTENLNRRFFIEMMNLNYYPIHFTTLVMNIKNVNAGSNNVYVPYNATNSISINKKGKVKFKTGDMSGDYNIHYNELATVFPSSYLSSKKMNMSEDYVTNILKAEILRQTMGEYRDKKMQEDEATGDIATNVYEELGQIDVSFLPEEERLEAEAFLVSEDNQNLIQMSDYYDFSYISDMGAKQYISELERYAIVENTYRSFVYDTYTKLPEDKFGQIIQLVEDYKLERQWKVTEGEPYQKLSEINSENYMTNVSSAIEYVKEYLALTTQYSLAPGKLPKGKDFVDYFLFESRKGYCMHYASAATIMFRAMGIPARYVEGYVVTADDFAKGQAKSTGEGEYFQGLEAGYENYDTIKMDIKDTNAHAWVEIYEDGFGWIPIEVTPGYSNGSTVTIPNDILNPSNNNTTGSLLSPSVKPIFFTLKPGQKKPTVTKKPSVKPGESSNKDNKKITALDYLVLILQVAGSIILIIGILVVCILLRRFIVIRKRERIRETQDISKRAISEYYEISRILLHYGLVYDGKMFVKEFTDQVNEKFLFLKEGEFELFLRRILKARYSKAWITNAEYDEVERFYQEFMKGIYTGLSRRKKLIYKYIKLF